MTEKKTTKKTIGTTPKKVTKKATEAKETTKTETTKKPTTRATATKKTAEKDTEKTVKTAEATERKAPKTVKAPKAESATEATSEVATTPAVTTEATTETPKIEGAVDTFKEFGLKRQLQKAIDKLGYTTPTQIQIEVWNAAKDGANVVGQSQTGTGKTTAFLLPILQQIDNKDRYPQVLIVAPTRELVQQIREDIMKLTEFLPMRSMTLMGGKSLRFQKEDLKYGPQFIVATPGRLIEFIQEGYLDVTKITHFVLDEVDRMLDMGFIEDVDRIWSQLPSIQQTMTFSATINSEIKSVIGKHCPEHIHIRVGERITVDKIDHTYIDLAHEHKFATLVNLLKVHDGQKTIIFSQTKRNTEVLTRALSNEGLKPLYLNGDLDMRQRTRALRAFKEGTCKILVTTDVAARGLNMDNVQLVINFDVPREPESYIHRIGRTGRAGADGKAIMFVDRDEVHLLMEIEKSQKIKLKKSDTVKAITDKSEDYFDVNLDRPLPPSEKKRRMVARSLARERGEFTSRSRYGSRSGGGFGGRSGGFGGGGRNNDRRPHSRGQFDNKPERTSRFGGRQQFGERAFGEDRAPRPERGSENRGGFRSESKSIFGGNNRGRSERTFGGDRSPRSEEGRRFDDRPRHQSSESRGGYGQRSFEGGSRNEARGGFGGNNRGRSERTFDSKPRGDSGRKFGRSIGGYDMDFISEQRKLDRDRFAPKGPRKDTKSPQNRDSSRRR